MTVSSIIPPFSFRRTDKVEVYGARDVSDEGVNHSKNAVAVGPRKLNLFQITVW
jgi:hypothetical protein